MFKFNRDAYNALLTQVRLHSNLIHSDREWMLQLETGNVQFVVQSQKELVECYMLTDIMGDASFHGEKTLSDGTVYSGSEIMVIQLLMNQNFQYGFKAGILTYINQIHKIIEDAIDSGDPIDVIRSDIQNYVFERHAYVMENFKGDAHDRGMTTESYVHEASCSMNTYIHHYNELTLGEQDVRDSVTTIYNLLVDHPHISDLKDFIFSTSIEDAIVSSTDVGNLIIISFVLPVEISMCGRMVAYLKGDDPMTKLGSIHPSEVPHKLQGFLRKHNLLSSDFYGVSRPRGRGLTPSGTNVRPGQIGDHPLVPSSSSSTPHSEGPAGSSEPTLNQNQQFQSLSALFGGDPPPLPISRTDGETDEQFAARQANYNQQNAEWAARHGVPVSNPTTVPLPPTPTPGSMTPQPPALPDDSGYEPDSTLARLARPYTEAMIADPNANSSHDHLTRFNCNDYGSRTMSRSNVKRGRDADWAIQRRDRRGIANFVVTYTRQNYKPIFSQYS